MFLYHGSNVEITFLFSIFSALKKQSRSCVPCASNMTREWLSNENTTPAKTLVTMMFKSMPETMRSIYFS